MSNKPYWLAVTVYVKQVHLEEVAECIAEDWFDDFGEEVFDLLGMTQKDLESELVDMPAVRDMIWKGVTEYGMAAFDRIYDAMDFDRVNRSKEMNCLQDTLEFLGEILYDVHNSKNDDCADAIATLKRAGYKIVKA
jgi:pantothenate kinase